ncbi:single-strand DNA-binding protein [Nocardioides thalensis]|uniref:Single-strand DNA-binding protein n=1 Tax=Nocardioides thalensis TaxID=1914755 RepID=A0A853BZI5_9ACTN|nr:single-stranded DNA-binding protein [Nocardioides thalensis]NYJ00444.1 single-strand DNA-binding protein [Nocardioides thalensis]
MSSDVIVTLEGWVGNDPQSFSAGEVSLAKFRLGHTPRRFRRQTGDWENGETQWFTVTAWRQLGAHCVRSIHKGDPVIVRGRLTQRTWQNKAGEDVVSLEVEALSVGHDLSMGISNFVKTVGLGRGDNGQVSRGGQAGQVDAVDVVADWRAPGAEPEKPTALAGGEGPGDSSAA